MDAIQKHLADNETHRALAAMEQRIRHLESVAFTLRDGILLFFFFVFLKQAMLTSFFCGRHETKGGGERLCGYSGRRQAVDGGVPQADGAVAQPGIFIPASAGVLISAIDEVELFNKFPILSDKQPCVLLTLTFHKIK